MRRHFMRRHFMLNVRGSDAQVRFMDAEIDHVKENTRAARISTGDDREGPREDRR
jgi:hypothetical protein